ncbi:regulatory protein RecX [Candidatus Berkelbacteria bacterium]|nr:regulatory protein RecX [Candidatus Berkelbacteria bacterium]
MGRLSALAYASFLLKNRLKSRFELERKLKEKKYLSEDIESALKQLQEVGAIDDQKFAKAYANDKLKYSRRGKFRISLELLQKGVDKEIINKTIKAIDNEVELKIAEELIQSKLRQWQHLDPLVRKRRLIALLQRRGFGIEAIKKLDTN